MRALDGGWRIAIFHVCHVHQSSSLRALAPCSQAFCAARLGGVCLIMAHEILYIRSYACVAASKFWNLCWQDCAWESLPLLICEAAFGRATADENNSNALQRNFATFALIYIIVYSISGRMCTALACQLDYRMNLGFYRDLFPPQMRNRYAGHRLKHCFYSVWCGFFGFNITFAINISRHNERECLSNEMPPFYGMYNHIICIECVSAFFHLYVHACVLHRLRARLEPNQSSGKTHERVRINHAHFRFFVVLVWDYFQFHDLAGNGFCVGVFCCCCVCSQWWCGRECPSTFMRNANLSILMDVRDFFCCVCCSACTCISQLFWYAL